MADPEQWDTFVDGFTVSEGYEFAGGKGIRVFHESRRTIDGKELTRRMPIKIWRSTSEQACQDLMVKGTRVKVWGWIDARPYKDKNDQWQKEWAIVLTRYEVLAYERKADRERDVGQF